jgi:hypothetical protein
MKVGDYKVGDYVEINKSESSFHRKRGQIKKIRDGKATIQLEDGTRTVGEMIFLQLVEEAENFLSRGATSTVGAQPLQAVDVQPLQVVEGTIEEPKAQAPQQSQLFLERSSGQFSPVESQPLQLPVEAETLRRGATSTVGVEALQILDRLRSQLVEAQPLQHCWIESYGRGSKTLCRLTWHKSIDKPAQYFDPKELSAYEKRVAAGRALRHLEALMAYLQRE